MDYPRDSTCDESCSKSTPKQAPLLWKSACITRLLIYRHSIRIPVVLRTETTLLLRHQVHFIRRTSHGYLIPSFGGIWSTLVKFGTAGDSTGALVPRLIWLLLIPAQFWLTQNPELVAHAQGGLTLAHRRVSGIRISELFGLGICL